MPLYNDSGAIVGRMSGAVALTSIATSMQRILDESEMFRGAYGAVYTPSSAAAPGPKTEVAAQRGGLAKRRLLSGSTRPSCLMCLTRSSIVAGKMRRICRDVETF